MPFIPENGDTQRGRRYVISFPYLVIFDQFHAAPTPLGAMECIGVTIDQQVEGSFPEEPSPTLLNLGNSTPFLNCSVLQHYHGWKFVRSPDATSLPTLQMT